MSSTSNPSGLKLSYNKTSGFFKGSFTIYAKKTATMAKRYTANVTGFMVGGSGAGSATVRNVGTYRCTIKDEATLEAERIAAEQAAAEQAAAEQAAAEQAAAEQAAAEQAAAEQAAAEQAAAEQQSSDTDEQNPSDQEQ